MKNILIFESERLGERNYVPAFTYMLQECRNERLPYQRVRSELLIVGETRFMFVDPRRRNLDNLFKKHTAFEYVFYRATEESVFDPYLDQIKKALPTKKHLKPYLGMPVLLELLPAFTEFPHLTFYRCNDREVFPVQVRPGDDTRYLFETEDEAYARLEQRIQRDVDALAKRLKGERARLREVKRKRVQASTRLAKESTKNEPSS